MSANTHTISRGSYLMPSLERATVADAMHPGIVSCEPDATLPEVARIMSDHRIHCLVTIGVSHQQPELFVWGIISDLDLLRAGIDGTDATARTLANQPIVSAEATMPLREAGKLMLEHKVSHLVVIDPRRERPIGVLSSLDVAGALAWGEA